MKDRITLSYFYGREAEQYSFYKIPKLLFTEEYFKKISVEAKVLYGLMLDRMSLSMKNQWLDEVIYALSDFLIMILSWLVKQSLRAFLFQEVQP